MLCAALTRQFLLTSDSLLALLGARDRVTNPNQLTMTKNRIIIGLMGIVAVLTLIVAATFMPALSFAGEGGRVADKCSTTTVARAVIGDDISSTIVSASDARAYVRIDLSTDNTGMATSSAFLNFGTAAATTASSFKLSTSTPYIEFGRNTDFPYVGTVTGISNGAASTTVLVTTCTY